MKKFITIGFSLLVTQAVWSKDVTITPGIGFGFTDNANYDEVDKESDFYNRLQLLGNFRLQDAAKINLSFSYDNYLQEQQNDVFRWSTKYTSALSSENWSAWGKVLGQHYSNRVPGYTEQTFNYMGAGGGADKTIDLNEKTVFTFGPGLIIKKFYGLGERLDKQIFASSMLDYELDHKNVLTGMLELGLIRSDVDAFDNHYIAFDIFVEHIYNPVWSFNLDLGVRRTVYYNRDISTPTIVTNRRGVQTTQFRHQDERYNFLSLGAGALAQVTDSDLFSFEANLSRQTSVSGLQDYLIREIFAGYQKSF